MAIFIGTALGDQINPAVNAEILDLQGIEYTTTSLAGNDGIFGGDGDDLFDGGSGSDTLTGDNGNDTLAGGLGNDLLLGGTGDDTLDDVQGQNTLYGGTGNDNFSITELTSVYGGAGTDEMVVVSSFGWDIDLGTGLTNTAALVRGVEILFMGSGSDTVDAGADAVTVFGGLGNDVVFGGLLADNLTGGDGNDQLDGQDGDDSLYGGTGNDLLRGGDGDDILDAGSGSDTAEGGNGNDLIVRIDGTQDGGSGDDTFEGGAFTDSLLIDMTTGDTNHANVKVFNFEFVVTGSGNDTIRGTSSADTIYGGAGNEVFEGSVSNGDRIFGGIDDDLFQFSLDALTAATLLDGGDGTGDTLDYRTTTLATNLNLVAGTSSVGGNLVLSLRSIENAYGGTGADRILGSAATNNLEGGEGNDTLFGGGGSDNLFGDIGNDDLYGGTGTDIIAGGDGNDRIFLTEGGSADADAGNGIDTLNMAGRTSGVIVDLVNKFTSAGDTINNFENVVGGSGGDLIVGNNGANVFYGGLGNDTLNGGFGANSLLGGASDDTYIVASTLDIVYETRSLTSGLDAGGIDTVESGITFSLNSATRVRFVENLTLTGTSSINGSGNARANELIGNSGNNVLNGGGGNDILTGGTGIDAFVFNTAIGATNRDTITDFSVPDDRIRLDDAIFAGLATGTLASAAFAANLTGLAADATDRIIYETDTGRLYFDTDGLGGAVRTLFATLQPNLALTNADFLVI